MSKMMYVCNPVKNVNCKKTGCLFFVQGECFSTLNPNYAVRNDNDEPVSFPEEKYEAFRAYMVKTWEKTVQDEMDRAILYGNVKRVNAPGKVVDE